MKAELQLLMLPSDAEAFLNFAKNHVDAIEDNQRLIVGDCELTFQASEQSGHTLFVGRLNINSGGLDDGCKDSTRANNIYRELRKWVKKNYDNRLSTWEEGKEEKMGRTRNQWLAPDAKAWKQSNTDAEIRFSASSTVYFDIAPEFSNMGGIEPKGNKFKARS
ncbi:MAG TPA: hypothetical protein EYG68_10580 [Leucothrix mucor]|nr:hypothetical protein [Leucothrix mucor]